MCLACNWLYSHLYYHLFYCENLCINCLFKLFLFWTLAAAAAKSLQSCPTLCDPIDGSPLGSPVPGTLQERTLEWVTISFSNVWKWKVKEKSLSRVWLFTTPWTAAYQAPLSMGFSRQEYWSGVPSPSPFWTLRLSYIQVRVKMGAYKSKITSFPISLHHTFL